MINSAITPIGEIQLDSSLFHRFRINELASIHEHAPDFDQELGIRCQHCNKNWFMATLYMADKTGCAPCCDAWEERETMTRYKKAWESVCPRELRETSINHEGFPKWIYQAHKGYDGTKSLFLFGPSGEGKTRTAALLMKRALIKGKTINFLWPEELKSYAKSQYERLQKIHELGKYDVLMMDDALLTGAQDERIADFLKDLIDFMQRHQRHIIITSQIGSEEYQEQADKFNNMTKADHERVAALLRRIKESFEVIPFVTPKASEPSF